MVRPPLVATVYLASDPEIEPETPLAGFDLVLELVSARRVQSLLEQGWVQFFFTKKTTGQMTSIIGTINKGLYTYTFKGVKRVRKRGLVAFVAFNRKGHAAWRSCYRTSVSSIVEENKNQARGKAGKNVRVNVDTGARTTIAWDYEKAKPA